MTDSLQPVEDPNRAIVGAGTPDVIAPGHTFGTVTDKISAIVLARKTPLGWYAGFGTAMLFTLLLLVSLTYLVLTGIGIWGNNIPIGWAFDITNFVWWIGIGHAGTLISAILLLLKQTWRTSINRFAEAMTLFAVACAAVFPVPGWHTTIFPPYFVAGAIYSGFAMVLTLAIPIRAVYNLEDFITMRHLQNMAKVMLVTGLIVAYGYLTEAFIAWYSADRYEGFVPMNRMFGPYAVYYWALILCNIVIPQSLWLNRVRTSAPMLFVIALIVNVGMWLERF